MSTIYSIHGESDAGSVAAADEFVIYQASSGRTKKATGAEIAAYADSNKNGGTDLTVTTLSLTQAVHANRPLTLSAAAPFAYTLPQSLGTGATYKFVVEVAAAATATASTIVTANSTDVLQGVSWCLTTASANVVGYGSTATSKTLSLNGTTKGGVVGDIVEITDVKTGFWSVKMFSSPTGTTVTPFS